MKQIRKLIIERDIGTNGTNEKEISCKKQLLGKILRAVLEALEFIKEATCVLQFCRISLDLIKIHECIQGVPVYAVQQAYY